jgi:hypothetical protein
VLALEEAADNAERDQLSVEIADVERRIEVHRAMLHLDDVAATASGDA